MAAAEGEAFVDPETKKNDPTAAEPKWMRRQRKLFTNFCNAKLCERDDVPPVTDVFEDIRDGRLLYALLEELSGQSLAPLGRIVTKKAPKVMTRIDHVSNLSISFRYINQTTKIVGIGPGDIADGNQGLILGLLWSLIVFFTAKDLGGVDDVSALKKKILKWCQKRTEKNPDVEVRNLKDSFLGGRAFLAILNDVDPTGSLYAPVLDAKENFKAAFEDAALKYGVPELLDPEDEECWKDEQAMVTYLSELMKRLPEPGPDMASPALQFTDDHFAETVDDLKELCAIPSIPTGDDPAACDRAAAKVASIMSKAGLFNVETLPCEGVPGLFVAASSPKFDKTLPTLLLVSDYGVDDPANMAWTTAPFEPTEVEGGDRLRAAAVASTKAGAVATIKAVGALVATITKDQRLPVNVDVLCACGRAKDYAEKGTVEAFIRARYPGEEAGRSAPDYVLVDTAGAIGDLAPGRFGVAFSCRGDCGVEVRLRTGDSAAALVPMEVGDVVGPALDANLALCKLIAGLRSAANQRVDVEGLPGFKAGSKHAAAMVNVDLGDATAFAAARGYPPEAKVEASESSLAERLALQSSLVLESLASAPPDGTYQAASAVATIRCSIAPAFPHAKAAEALARACEAKAPWATVATAAALPNGRTGFLAEVSPLLAKIPDAAAKHFPAPAAVAGAPGYTPLAACVQRALPTSVTYALGNDDPNSNLGQDAENVKLDDVKATIKTFISLIVACKAGIKKRPHATHPDFTSLFATQSAANAEP